MKIIRELEYEQYIKLARKYNQDHILHSLNWAKFRQRSGWEYEFIGFESDGQLQAACLVIKKALPFFKKNFTHIPRGFIGDYSNLELITNVTMMLKELLKKDSFAFRIDPDIKRWEIDKNREKKEDALDNSELITHLQKIGYKHRGFVDNFEGIFPRLTFRNYLIKSNEEMYEQLMPKTKTAIETSKVRGIEVYTTGIEGIDDFMGMLNCKANRDNLIHQNKEYFINLMESFGEDFKLVFTNLNTKVYLNNITNMIEELKNENTLLELKKNEVGLSNKRKNKISNTQTHQLMPQINKLDRELDVAKQAIVDYPNGVLLTGSLYLFNQSRAWYMFAGSNELFKDTMPSYSSLWYMLTYCNDNDYEFLDLYGCSGNLDSKGPHFGLYLFKNRFGGEFEEFIGEFDYILNPFIYFMYIKVVPKFQTSKDSKLLRFILKLIGK